MNKRRSYLVEKKNDKMMKIGLKPELKEKEKIEKISFLRKQRDGLIIGTYRNALASTYREIEARGTCCITATCKELGITDHEKNLLKDYCLDLEQLGYIKINEAGDVFVIQPLDF